MTTPQIRQETPEVSSGENAEILNTNLLKNRGKAPSAFRTISEVADTLDVQQHVLRFWETKFTQIRPLKRGGGRRYYRPEDVALLERIHHLLYTEGYTIKGVQKLLKGQTKGQIAAAANVQQQAVVAAPTQAAVPATVDIPAPAQDMPVVAETAAGTSRARPGLSDRQRIILESMLGDLKELRSLIRQG